MAPSSVYSRLRLLRYRLPLYLVVALSLAMPARAFLEHHFLYFPEPGQSATPRDIGLAYEAVTFPATDGTALTGWLVPGAEGAPVVLFCIGNAGNISHRLDTLKLLNRLGVAVFIFNYRGYGTSAGRADEAGTYADAAGAVAWLEARGWTLERMIFFGRSLGAAVALETALRTPPAGLVMEAPFTSIAAMGRHHYPGLSHLLGWLVGAEYDNLGKVARLERPLLLIHGRRDTICPPAMAEQLRERAGGATRLHWIDGADHNDTFLVGGTGYHAAWRETILDWTGFSLKP